jgi:hypothetical protein
MLNTKFSTFKFTYLGGQRFVNDENTFAHNCSDYGMTLDLDGRHFEMWSDCVKKEWSGDVYKR